MININKRAIVIGVTNIDTIRCSNNEFIKCNPASERITSSAGGVGRNVCENLSRMGISTMLISAVSNDSNGKELIHQCVSVGIDCEGVLVSDMEIAEVITPEHISKFASHLDNGDVIFMDTNLSRESIEYVLKNWGNHIPVFIDTVSIANATKLKGITENIYCLKPNLAEAIAITAS